MTLAKGEYHPSTAFYNEHLDLIWSEIVPPAQYEAVIMHGESCSCCNKIIYTTELKRKPKRKRNDFVRID